MMKQFTKDELKLIQDNLHWSDCTDANQKLLLLNKKLQGLIDNYCADGSERDMQCIHLFKDYEDYSMCVHCEQKKSN